jgi:hypothetical protein
MSVVDVELWRPMPNGTTMRRGRAPIGAAPDNFVLRTTKPSAANTGPDLTQIGRSSFIPYTGPGAGDVFTITASSTQKVFEGYDFGSTRIIVLTTGVKFRHCRWNNKIEYRHAGLDGSGRPRPIAMIDCTQGSSANYIKDTEIYRCEITSETYFNPVLGPIRGHGFKAERNNISGFADGIGTMAPTWDTPGASTYSGGQLAIKIHGNYIHDLIFQYSPVQGIAHPTDTKRIGHPDLWQHQGGKGSEAIGNFFDAHYSEVWGIGVPGSGKDLGGAPNIPEAPTQAQGDTAWYANVEVNGTLSTGPRAKTANIVPIMVNWETGAEVEMLVEDNWSTGGSVGFVNAADTGLTGNLGWFRRNKHVNNNQYGGVYYLFKAGLTAVLEDNVYDPPTGTTIGRTTPA